MGSGVSQHPLHIPTSLGSSSSTACHLTSPLSEPRAPGPRAHGPRPGLTRLLLRGKQRPERTQRWGFLRPCCLRVSEDTTHHMCLHRMVGSLTATPPGSVGRCPDLGPVVSPPPVLTLPSPTPTPSPPIFSSLFCTRTLRSVDPQKLVITSYY